MAPGAVCDYCDFYIVVQVTVFFAKLYCTVDSCSLGIKYRYEQEPGEVAYTFAVPGMVFLWLREFAWLCDFIHCLLCHGTEIDSMWCSNCCL